MNIVVAVRCYNEERNIERFLRGYSFADKIVISDGGSTDKSLEIINRLKNDYPIDLHHFEIFEVVDGVRWNPDAPHMNFVLDKAKEQNPDWLIFDDMDDVPNYILRNHARNLFENCDKAQINVFRLYMWGNTEFFPKMNNYFDTDYRSLWAWKPKILDIHADPAVKHGTIVGITGDNYKVDLPMCLLHKSWIPETIDAKVDKYNRIGLPMNHPVDGTFGQREPLPEFARED